MQDSTIDKKIPLILKITMIFTILSVVMRFIAENYWFSVFEMGISIFWHFAFLFLLVTQLLLILFFYKTKQYETAPFVLLSTVAIILAGFIFLTDIAQSVSVVLLKRTLVGLSSFQYSLKFMELRPLAYQLPFIILATTFLAKMHYTFMRNISFVALIISGNVVFIETIERVTYHLFFSTFLWEWISSYTFYLSLFLFVLGLLIDHNKPKEKIKESFDTNYVYPYDENKTFSGYFSFLGRIDRFKYWTFIITGSIVFGGFLTIGITTKSVAIYLITLSIFAYISLCVNTKRLHDVGISGWYQLVGFIPVIGQILLIWKYMTPGQPFDNIYGSKTLNSKNDNSLSTKNHN